MRSRRLRHSRAHSLVVGLLAGLGLAGGLAGCSGLEPVSTYEPITDPAQLYMRLVLNHRAVTLSTAASANALALTATPLDASGQPMTGLPAPTFRSSDTTSVWVTPEGVLQARGPATGVTVIADLVAPGNVRHADTAIVNVNATTDPPPVLVTFSFDPVPPDSAVRALPVVFGNTFAIEADAGPFSYDGLCCTAPVPEPQALDGGGNPIPGLVIAYRSLDTTIAKVRPDRSLALVYPGQARVEAQTTAYGVTQVDTVVFTVTWPIAQEIVIAPGPDGVPRFTPAEVRLAPSGVVVWDRGGFEALPGGDPVDVTFEDPTNVALAPAAICDRFANPFLQSFGYFGPGAHCGTGDMLVPGVPTDPSIPSFAAWSWAVQVRQFPVPGVYRYHSTRTGATGRIVVTTDPDPTPAP